MPWSLGRGFWINCALAVGSVLVVLAALEAGCRLFVRPALDRTDLNVGWASIEGLGQVDPVLGYRLLPDRAVAEYATNNLGYRADPVAVPKPEGVFRILCLGGSTTIGSNAGHNRYTYPAILNDFFAIALAGTGKTVEVINAGVFGYHSWHSVLRLEAERRLLAPDMVVVMDGINDVMAAYNTSTQALEQGRERLSDRLGGLVNKPGAAGTDPAFGVRRLLGQSALYRTSARVLPETLAKTGLFASMLQRKLDLFGYAANMERLVADDTAHGVETILVNYPWIVQPDSTPAIERGRIPFPLQDSHYAVYGFGRQAIAAANRAVAEKTGVPLVDPQPVFDRLTENPAAIADLYSDTMHFTRYGNFILAQAIYPRLAEDPGLQRFLGGMRLPSAGELAERFPELSDWPALRREPDAKWRLLGFAPAMAVTGAQNLVESMDGSWIVDQPADAAKPARLTLVLLETPRHSGLVALPRSASSQDVVAIDRVGEGGRQRILTFAAEARGAWTPARRPAALTLPADCRAGDVFEVTLTGKDAQLWRFGSRILFPGQLLLGP